MSSEKILRHVVLFSFKAEANQEQIAEVGRDFLALPARIKAIDSLEWGSAINQQKPYSHCLLVMARTEADLKVYEDHPDHKAVGTKFGHLFDSVVVLDYWTNEQTLAGTLRPRP